MFLEKELVIAEVALVRRKKDEPERVPFTHSGAQLPRRIGRQGKDLRLVNVRRYQRRTRRGAYAHATRFRAVLGRDRRPRAARMRRKARDGHRSTSADWFQNKKGHREDCQY